MIEKDKIQHFVFGFAITGLIEDIVKDKNKAIILSLGVGIGKEVWDSLDKKHHTPDVKDFLAHGIGAILKMLMR